jgi:hypothetical protein
MINENLEMTNAEANAKVIADLDQAQASFMAIRALQREVEEMKMVAKQN